MSRFTIEYSKYGGGGVFDNHHEIFHFNNLADTKVVEWVVETINSAAQHGVQADGAWVCDRCGHNATSTYCSNCNLPFPPRR